MMGSKPGAGGAILCFHSITSASAPAAASAHVPLSLLEGAIRTARRLGEIVPLGTIVDRHRAGQSTARLIAFTFDDAYFALTEDAAGVLSAESVPATIFVTADAARAGARFWWDRVEDVRTYVSDVRWQEFTRACGIEDRQAVSLLAFRDFVLGVHRGRWPKELEPALQALEQAAGVTTAHRSMTFAEIRGWQQRAPIEIGVHTLSHPVLPFLDDADIAREITACYNVLAAEFGSVQPILAVPYGLFDRRTIAIARDCGMIATLSLSGTTLAHSTDALDIPRVCITREMALWKLRFRMNGMVDRIRQRKLEFTEYPALPAQPGRNQ